MNKLLLILLLLPASLIGQKKFYPYVEANAGVAIDYWKASHPAASLMLGSTFNMGDYSLVDVQIGAAIPSIITGKIGVGSYFGQKQNMSIIGGCRIYPLMFYGQFTLGQVETFQFVLSGEVGGGGPKSLDLKYLFNAGFRWSIKLKQK